MRGHPLARSMRSHIVGPVLAYLRDRGVDPTRLAARFDLPGDVEAAPAVVLPLARLHAFLDDAERLAGDPFLGVHVAARLPRGTYELVEFSCHSAPTVRHALHRIARYTALLNDLAATTFEERGGLGVVEQRISGAPVGLGRHANECWAVMITRRMRALSGVEVAPTRAWFGHPAPRDTSALAAALGTRELAFDAGASGLSLTAATLALPLVTSDPPLLSVLDRQAELNLSLRGDPRDLLGQVRQAILDRLRGGAPDLDVVARALGMSGRTLQRRLTAGGTRYSDVLDALRREMSGAWVRDTDVPLGEIAERLGYLETSAFLRAFRRWHGAPASRVRGARGVP